MLRKRNRSYQKDQKLCRPISDAIPESDVLGHKTNSFFNAPGLFVGFSPKSSESDSVRSPTSPLDFRVFSNLTNPFIRSPRSSSNHQKSWDCNKVGLGIVDSLDDDAKLSGKILRSSDSKNILFGPQMRIKPPNFQIRIDSFEAPKSLPKDYGVFPHTHQIKPSKLQKGSSDVVFEIGETPFESKPFGKLLSCSLDSGSHLTSCLTNHNNDSSSGNFCSINGTIPVSYPLQIGNSSSGKLNSIPISIGSAHDFFGSLSASEIELSEDYTCVKTYGPNPKTTHIFGDCILECHNNNLTNLSKNEEEKIQLHSAIPVKSYETPTPYPSSDFLSFCYSCKKKLEGEDIYMYRGEKAFCSWDCRSHEILVEEAMEDSPERNSGEELSETGMFIAA
ncbi:hypothetical protein CEY00_Acc12490 [Actinidia chinensis var. chinensis]|uniref:FLZ-type domain-containing protein n=1 Tax=Actinidia chinensis var. chinensis TaxID=1590841 RepID=A0A2R6QZL4_ACTCC|nr:hypothetical protein CEY00_Acc12490 [Actinidia chinensis var. chinensis]